MKKIRPSHKYTYLTFLIIFVALEFLLWGIVGTKWWAFEGDYVKQRLWIEITYTSIALILCFMGAFIYRLKVYYLVDGKKIVRHASKDEEYHFNDIVYLDKNFTHTHSDIRFYINTGKWVTLTKDPQGEILQLISNKAKLLSDDEFILKYPNANL